MGSKGRGGRRFLGQLLFCCCDKNTLKRAIEGKGVVILPQSSRVQFMMVENSWQQDLRQLVALYLCVRQNVERDECWCAVHALSIGWTGAALISIWGGPSYLDLENHSEACVENFLGALASVKLTASTITHHSWLCRHHRLAPVA